jgi:hypothetical protein
MLEIKFLEVLCLIIGAKHLYIPYSINELQARLTAGPAIEAYNTTRCRSKGTRFLSNASM